MLLELADSSDLADHVTVAPALTVGLDHPIVMLRNFGERIRSSTRKSHGNGAVPELKLMLPMIVL